MILTASTKGAARKNHHVAWRWGILCRKGPSSACFIKTDRQTVLIGTRPHTPPDSIATGSASASLLSPARTLSDIRTYVLGHFGHFGHMSSDTSRTLAGHWPDTLGHTGHTFGQTRCAGGVQVSQGVSGHSRTLSDTTILPLSAHYSLFFMVSPTILLPSC